MRNATRAPAASRFATYGRGTHVLEPVRVEGPEHMHLGAGVLIHELAWIIARPATDGTPPRLTVGDGTSIFRFAKIVCTGEVTIGPRCLVADHVYISDTHYRHAAVEVPIAQQGLAPPEPVHIGADVMIGYGVKILPGVTVGADAYLGAGAVVTEDVPAQAVVVGNPARVIGRTRAS